MCFFKSANRGINNCKKVLTMEEMTEDKRGVWLNFPECTPDDGEQVVVKRNGWYEILVYNEYHQCWDDSEGDDYCCELNEVDKFLRIPKEQDL